MSLSSHQEPDKFAVSSVPFQNCSTPSYRITLVGAGLAGCLLAIYLAKRGFQVDIYERRPDLRKVKISGGRSINLTLAARGIQALKEVGLYEKVRPLTIPLEGRIIHTTDGSRIFQSYGQQETDVLYALRRIDLQHFLLNELEKFEKIQIHFNQRCTDIDWNKKELHLRDTVSNQPARVAVNVVIATDGSTSAIRKAMQAMESFNFQQSYLDHGYKEITIPAAQNQKIDLEKNVLHVWPRIQYMLNGFPNLDGSTTCVLFAPFEGENGLNGINSKEKVIDLFQHQFPDIFDLIPNLAQTYLASKTGRLTTIKCHPWHFENKALLIGDAAHAIVPFHGQGMNCAFEDCVYLNQCIDKYGTDWQSVFQEFEKQRKINTDAIADLSLQNYTELRDHIADHKFLLKKKIEALLSEKYPEHFIPKFSMVCFSSIPYSIAQKKGAIQETIIEELAQTINDIQEIDWTRAKQLIKQKLLQPCLP